MSWVDRKLINREDDLILPSEEQKSIRAVKEDNTTFEDVVAKGTPNVVKLSVDRFVCPKCDEGWTFARMRSITCCGITYVKD